MYCICANIDTRISVINLATLQELYDYVLLAKASEHDDTTTMMTSCSLVKKHADLHLSTPQCVNCRSWVSLLQALDPMESKNF